MLDFPAFPWIMFEPLRRAFDNAVEETVGFLILHQALAEAANRPIGDIEPDEWATMLDNPEIMSRFETQYAADETLQEVVSSQFERIEEEFTTSLSLGRVDLALFTDEELAVGIAWYEHESEKAEDEGDNEEEETDSLMLLTIRSSAEALKYLNTPARRQRWLERLKQAETRESWPGKIRAGLRLFGNILADPPQSEEPDRLLLSAYIGELSKEDDRLSIGSSEAQVQLTRVQEIKERLERGEPPLS
jgi:hypothetical protein